MNAIDKYLDAISAALDVDDKEAIQLLEAFTTHLYKELYAKANSTSGEEQAMWDSMLKRVQVLIARMAKAGPEIW
jgi:hypothetical protein